MGEGVCRGVNSVDICILCELRNEMRILFILNLKVSL